MIGALREWLTSIVVVTLLLSVAQMLVPEGSIRRVASFAGGLILLVALLRPVLGADLERLRLDLDGYERELQNAREELSSAGDTEVAERIAERTAAYISDKAASLGINCRAEVTTAAGEDGVPRPDRVELSCGKSAALSAYIAEELGIPEERQVFHGDG